MEQAAEYFKVSEKNVGRSESLVFSDPEAAKGETYTASFVDQIRTIVDGLNKRLDKLYDVSVIFDSGEKDLGNEQVANLRRQLQIAVKQLNEKIQEIQAEYGELASANTEEIKNALAQVVGDIEVINPNEGLENLFSNYLTKTSADLYNRQNPNNPI